MKCWLVTLALACSALPASAQVPCAAVPCSVTLGWDASPTPGVVQYTLFLDGAPAATTAMLQATVPVTPGTHQAAVNAATALRESPQSAAVTFVVATPPITGTPPLPPGNLHVVIAPSADTLVDKDGHIFGLTASGQLTRDGAPQTWTGKMLKKTADGHIALRDSDGVWWGWPLQSESFPFVYYGTTDPQ